MWEQNVYNWKVVHMHTWKRPAHQRENNEKRRKEGKKEKNFGEKDMKEMKREMQEC